MEDIVLGCSYFENDAEFYWKPVKLFEGRGDVRPINAQWCCSTVVLVSVLLIC